MKTAKEEEKNNYSEYYYQECKSLIEVNSDKIDLNNCEQNFHNNNRIIKHILPNLLTN